MKMTMTIKTVLAMMMTMMVTMTITSFTTMVRIVVRNIRQLKEMVAAKVIKLAYCTLTKFFQK